VNLDFELTDSVIVGNTSGENGGGLYCAGGKRKVSRNIFSGNVSASRGGGAFIGSVNNQPSAVFSHNRIFDNIAERGSGFFCCTNYLSVMHNLINDNHATEYGGGMVVYLSHNTKFANNTVAQNTAAERGGGIYFDSCDAELTNMILRYNESPDGNDYYLNNASDPVINYSIIDDSYPGVGNIDIDPGFVDHIHRDFHLLYNSPCRDAGDNNAVLSPVDFEGDPCPAHGQADMGSDEFYRHLYCMGEASPGGMIDIKLIGMPGTSPVGLAVGSGVLDPPNSTAWGDLFLALPLLFWISPEPIPTTGVLALPVQIPATPPAPYDIPLQALIGLDPNALSNLELLQIR